MLQNINIYGLLYNEYTYKQEVLGKINIIWNNKNLNIPNFPAL